MLTLKRGANLDHHLLTRRCAQNGSIKVENLVVEEGSIVKRIERSVDGEGRIVDGRIANQVGSITPRRIQHKRVDVSTVTWRVVSEKGFWKASTWTKRCSCGIARVLAQDSQCWKTLVAEAGIK